MIEKPKKNEGNKNAALKPGTLGRVQATISLSGMDLLQFRDYLISTGDLSSEITDQDAIKAIIRERIRVLSEAYLQNLKAAHDVGS